jgi:predicted glycosyltransferase
MSESIYTKMKQKQTHHENPQSKNNNLKIFSQFFDILMENGNNKLMNIHNKLILAFQIGIIALFNYCGILKRLYIA